MRLKLFVCGVTTLVPALLLAGCGVDQTSMIEPNVQSAGITGQAMGGQQPVIGATIEVVSMGTTGYGSAGTVLSSGTTDANGDFILPSYTCPQSNTPVYLLGIGGNAGAGTNNSAVEAAALGPCSSAQKSYVIMNEVTTAVAAFVFSHYFSTAVPTGGTTPDAFGGPSSTSGGVVTYSRGMVYANNVTYPQLVTNFDGAPNQGSSSVTTEWQKVYTIANVIAACINSSGSKNGTETKTTCGKLFNYTDNGAATRPADTLQAAVQMALYPLTNVTKLYALIGTTPAFSTYLASAPHDWTIGVSYTTSSMGLAVDTGTLTTLDIDSSNHIWFPSNASGKVGAAYFNPANDTFNGPYNTTGLVHPQQVAIDANGYAWLNDSDSATVSGYLTSSPTQTETVAFPNTNSQALTVGGDDRIDVGVTVGTGTYEMGYISADRSSYSLASGASFKFPVTTMAGDTNGGDAVSVTDTETTTMRYYYATAAPPTSSQIGTANDDSGQAIFTGNDDVVVRSYASGAQDGLCIYSLAACYGFQGSSNNTNVDEGIAIDGGKQLWVAESANGGLLQVPVNNATGTGAGIYLNGGGSNIPVNEFLHGSNNGGTAVAPYGIGVDNSGNVWMTNAGCTTSDCTPGTFTLTEIIGVAYPTITPVSAQITSGNLVGTEPTY